MAVPRASIDPPVIEIVPIAIYLWLTSLIAGLAGIGTKSGSSARSKSGMWLCSRRQPDGWSWGAYPGGTMSLSRLRTLR